jgi:hypothetical protein
MVPVMSKDIARTLDGSNALALSLQIGAWVDPSKRDVIKGTLTLKPVTHSNTMDKIPPRSKKSVPFFWFGIADNF